MSAPLSAVEIARQKMSEKADKAKAQSTRVVEEVVEKPKWTPIKNTIAWFRKRKYENEKRMLRNEEQMKSDVERFLMEIEEQHTWVESELNHRNFVRLKKQEVINVLKKKEAQRIAEEDEKNNMEQGLRYNMGTIVSFRRWQNSPAKFQDITGHTDIVYSVKLSPCLQYVLSCSEDRSARLWHILEGRTKYPLLVYEGHDKKVLDCGIHPNFKIDESKAHIITCSGDSTIKLWGTLGETALKTVRGHTEAVYKIVFSRDGKRVASASEDLTIRSWCYPEMYCLYIYQGHKSSIYSLDFSPTCRYIVSGSDYGERKIMLWDARMPRFIVPLQYPHMLFWNTEGMLTKIIIRQYIPAETFWMTGDQMQYLGDDAPYEVWTGELVDVVVPDTSDSESSDDEDMVDELTREDVTEINGCILSAIYTDKTGKRIVPTEYIPGGFLTIIIESQDVPLAEAFIDVFATATQFDMYAPQSGDRLGNFVINHPTPWEMEDAIVDPLGYKKPRRQLSSVPTGLVAVGGPPYKPSDWSPVGNEGKAVIFRNGFEIRPKEPVEGVEMEEGETEEVPLHKSKFEIVWFCPEPDLGPAVIKCNFRFNHVDRWETLKLTLRESPMRIRGAGKDEEAEPEQEYDFDQEARHMSFFRFIREKNWDALEQFLDPKCVIFKEKLLKKRRWRCMDMLEDIFDHHKGIVMPTPVIFKGGLTKSVFMMEACPLWNVVQKSESDGEDDGDDDDDDSSDEEEEDEDDEDEEDDAHVADEDKDDTSKEDDDGSGEGASEKRSQKSLDDEQDDGYAYSADAMDDAPTTTSGGSQKSPEGLSPISSPSASPRGPSTPRSIALNGTDGHGIKESTSPRGAAVVTPSPAETPRNPDGSKIVRFNPVVQMETIDDMTIASSIPETQDGRHIDAGHSKLRTGGPMGIFDSKLRHDDDEFAERLQAHHQGLTDFIFTGEVVGKHFQHDVLRFARKEVNSVMLMKTAGVAAAKEIRMYSTNPARQNDLALIPSAPAWIRSSFLKHKQPIPEKKSPPRGYYDLRTHPFLKSDTFGPDIQMYSMPLPANYPRRAGQARGAFRLQLSQYEAIRRKMDDQAIPTNITEEDDDTGAGGVSGIVGNEMKKFRAGLKDLENAIKGQVALHLVAERAYLATRRNALGELPGMQNHYPNRHYTDPAVDMPYMEEMPDEGRPFFAWLWGKKHLQSRKVPPVGRKPKPPKPSVERVVQSGENAQSDDDGQLPENLVGPDENVNENGVRPPSSQSLQSSKSSDRPTSKDSAHSRPDSGGSAESSENSGKSKNHDTHHHHHDTLGADPNSEEDNNAAAEYMSMQDALGDGVEAEAQAAADLAKAYKTEFQRRKRLGIPQNVFLERRGSFPFAPGLEPFDNGVKDPIKKVHVETPDPREGHKPDAKKGLHGHNHKSTSVGTNSTHAQFIPNDEVDVIATKGLLRVFTTHHSQSAHTGSINAIKFAPSEARLASAGGDSSVKIWDPRDGTLVRTLTGHLKGVCSLAYTADELYLVSSSEDQEILIWDMTSNSIYKRLRGHFDAVTSVSISPDCTLLVSSGYDKCIKTWYMTPRAPAAPDPPKIISKTDTTATISWSAPPSFNLDITAFHIQNRIGLRGEWFPPEGGTGRSKPHTVMPTLRSAVVSGLAANTLYQFRLRAENLMGMGQWSQPSKLSATELGFPGEVEIPKICGCTTHSLTVYWFTPSPETFAGASRQFEVARAGEGKLWDDHPLFPLTLDEALEKGRKVLQYFKDKLTVKKFQIVQRADKKDMVKEEDMGFQIANKFMQEILDKVDNDDTHLFAAIEVTGLRPGFQYRLRMRGVNEAGPGPWSPASYSIYTLPVVPDVPARPFIETRTMTTIKFTWHAPDGNGSAITGYTVHVKHLDKYFNLTRSQLSYEVIHLLPGKAFFIRVQARNAVGASAFSDWNEDSYENATTLTDKPEQPRNPRVFHGTWNSMTIDIRLPYDNGSRLTTMIVQQRWVKPFEKGEWHAPRTFRLPEDVQVLESVDPDALLKKLLEKQREEENERKERYNPLKKGKPGINIAAMLSQAKPDGSLVRVTINNLVSDWIWEFKVTVRNAAGFSKYSNPSHRAKTNAAKTPGPPILFTVNEVTDTTVVFTANWQLQGGAHIDKYVAEMLRLGDSEKTYRVTWDREKPFVAPHTPVTLKVSDHLKSGSSYKWRICAENEIGAGPWSEWSEEATIPRPPGAQGEDATPRAEAEKGNAQVGDDGGSDSGSDDPDSDFEGIEDIIKTAAGGAPTKPRIVGDAALLRQSASVLEMAIKVPPPTKKM